MWRKYLAAGPSTWKAAELERQAPASGAGPADPAAPVSKARLAWRKAIRQTLMSVRLATPKPKASRLQGQGAGAGWG